MTLTSLQYFKLRDWIERSSSASSLKSLKIWHHSGQICSRLFRSDREYVLYLAPLTHPSLPPLCFACIWPTWILQEFGFSTLSLGHNPLIMSLLLPSSQVQCRLSTCLSGGKWKKKEKGKFQRDWNKLICSITLPQSIKYDHCWSTKTHSLSFSNLSKSISLKSRDWESIPIPPAYCYDLRTDPLVLGDHVAVKPRGWGRTWQGVIWLGEGRVLVPIKG